MLLWTFRWFASSLLLILLIHYLYTYMKNALTIPIVETTTNKNTKRYDDMFDVVHPDYQKEKINNSNSSITSDKTNDSNSMKDELQTFLDDLKKNSRTSDPIPGQNADTTMI